MAACGAWWSVAASAMGHHGMSVYGVSAGSAVPFAAALLLAADAHLAAFRLAPAEKWLALLLQAVALLLIGVLLVPMSPRVVPGIAHSALGTSLFIAQLIVGARLVSRSQTARLFLQAALAIQVPGRRHFTLALLDLSDTMFAGQVVTQLAWAPLVVPAPRTRFVRICQPARITVMPAMRERGYTFGNGIRWQATRLGCGPTQTLDSARPEVDTGRIDAALEDINRTWGIITDPETGRRFEVAHAQLDAPLSSGVDLECSTFTSSLSGNAGNAVEFAQHSTLTPAAGASISPISGTVAPLRGVVTSTRHRRHRTVHPGRWDAAADRRRPSAGVEAGNGLVVTRVSANSGGCATATALVAALPENQVTHAFFRSRPNVSAHQGAIAFGLHVVLGDVLDDVLCRLHSAGSDKLSARRLRNARARLPRLMERVEQSASLPHSEGPGIAPPRHKMVADMFAFSRGGPDAGFWRRRIRRAH